MTATIPPHEFFDRLCAMSAANQASADEEAALAEHLESCSLCKESLHQYRQIVVQTFEVGPAYSSQASAFESPDVDPLEHRRAKERLLRGTREIIQLPLTEAPAVERASKNGFRPLTFSSSGLPAWATWGFAACLILAASGASLHYWPSTNPGKSDVTSSKDSPAKASLLEKQFDELRQELAKARADHQKSLADAQVRVVSETQKLRAENQDLRQNLSRSESEQNRGANEYAALEERIKLLQTSLDTLQESNSTLESDKSALVQRVSSLTADLRQSRDEMDKVEARNQNLTRESLTQVRFVERQQRLLATDHDLRDILGARSLRIIDVYDVGSQGEFERPFGRIFYTEGKFLIFYAFDLDRQKGLKSRTIFQAWGEKAEGKDGPRSLGTFYMDDPSQNRWILKVDDAKVLSRIDYVFVTDSSQKQGTKPRGKPLLSASLNTSVNHP